MVAIQMVHLMVFMLMLPMNLTSSAMTTKVVLILLISISMIVHLRMLDRPIADPGLAHVGDATAAMLTTILGRPPTASGHAWFVAQMSSMM